ncbi:hypothetical protein [Spirosoma endophyticum]|uniref:Uncharacterized protein n=1 Tax=Spirosoma endophyticum TaxID=662367 RepID=A0A1I2DUW1_9BACT|nr:hypothetical protein [Spirosoma endophyticum]SFE84021.1 hypothetical protein SAMN05216167_12069 [Spirosoma endophyticum]
MNRAETILAELVQSVAGTTDASSIPYVMKGCQGPAYAIEHQAGGTNRANDATVLVVDALRQQMPTSKLIRPVILRIRTHSKFPLLMRELGTITEGIQAIVGRKPSQFLYLQDDKGQSGDQLMLSLVYWLKDIE